MTTQMKRTKYAGPLAVAWSLIALLNASQLLLSDGNPGGFGDTLTGLLLVANVGLAAVYGVAWYRQFTHVKAPVAGAGRRGVVRE